jgi:signal transduction histidine kinase
MAASVLKLEDEDQFGIIHYDISDRKLALSALEEASKRKDEFLAVLAHELRNPLTPIHNGVEYLINVTPLPSDQRSHKILEMMRRQTGTLVRLVDDLIDVSRIDQGKVRLNMGDIELLRVMRTAVETVSPLIEGSRRAIKMNFCSSINVHGDLTRLTQIFVNLLNNAIKHTTDSGLIEISAETKDGFVTVSVKDNGRGIAPDSLSKIFELFSQVEETVGLGVGLALVKKLVGLHGGTINALSDGLGKGSIFIVRLPLAT